jgi:hypothetical protein
MNNRQHIPPHVSGKSRVHSCLQKRKVSYCMGFLFSSRSGERGLKRGLGAWALKGVPAKPGHASAFFPPLQPRSGQDTFEPIIC